MYHSRDLYYKTPFGACPAGSPVRFRLRLPAGTPAPLLELYRPDDVSPAYTAAFALQAKEGGEEVWQCAWTPPRPELLFYWFECGGRKLTRCAGDTADWDAGHMWQLTVYDPAYRAPAALAGATAYQIFPDRYASSEQRRSDVPGDRILHYDWRESPVSAPDADGVFRCNDFFGGDLRGIEEKLDELCALGVGILYLNPIFEARSNHRYNTADYRKIDPLLGDEKDFTQLCAACARRGIAVVLDGVFNHTGSDSVYFNKDRHYGTGGAYNDRSGPYYGWYRWKKWPDEYDCWWGFDTLPDINESAQSYIDFICGPDGVVRHWLRAGASGFRLDVADELPDAFIEALRRAVKAEGEDKLLLGEVWEDASSKVSYGVRRRYLLGTELDGVMNYPWRAAILDFCRSGGGQALSEAVLTLLENYPAPAVGALLNSLSTHDTVRAVTALGGEESEGRGRDWQREHNALSPEQYGLGRQLFLLASALQFGLPGCPCVYYGDEAGLTGYADPFNRGTYPWGREDAGLRDCLRLMGKLRCAHPALRAGSYRTVFADGDLIAFLREDEGERVMLAVNRGGADRTLPGGGVDLTRAERLLTVGGLEGLTLRARSAVFLAEKK